MLALQVRVLMAWQSAREQMLSRLPSERDDRGEVTATMAMIAILVVAAMAAAAFIATRMSAHAKAVPPP